MADPWPEWHIRGWAQRSEKTDWAEGDLACSLQLLCLTVLTLKINSWNDLEQPFYLLNKQLTFILTYLHGMFWSHSFSYIAHPRFPHPYRLNVRLSVLKQKQKTKQNLPPPKFQTKVSWDPISIGQTFPSALYYGSWYTQHPYSIGNIRFSILCTLAGSVSSYMYQPCCVWKSLLSWSAPPSLVLILFLTFHVGLATVWCPLHVGQLFVFF